jgi:Secretion system C-terminal sorting domain
MILSAFMLIAVHLFSQENYVITRGTSNYDTLTNFTSVVNDILMSPFISGTVVQADFGFHFPFFGAQYDSVWLDGDGVAYFPNDSNYNFYFFTGEGFENRLFANQHTQSDWRLKKDTANGVKVLKVEWRNVGLLEDVTGAHPTNEFLNFQAWFYENGIIELHFGQIDLTNSPYYSDSLGAMIDTNGIFGPYIGIENMDLSRLYFVTGNNANFSVITVDTLIDIFRSIPPPGQFYRFAPLGTSDIDELLNNQLIDFDIYPNPASQSMTIGYKIDNSCMVSLAIYDELGRQVWTISPAEQDPGRHQIKFARGEIRSAIYVVELKLGDQILHKSIILN